MQDSLNQWIPGKQLKPGEKLKTPDGQTAVVVGGSVPADHDGWMWDLTVPGNNDHDFYVDIATTAVLVHNCGGLTIDDSQFGAKIGKHAVTESGRKGGRWTVDHQPPNKLAPNGPWTGYPQCAACAAQQGGIVRTILKEQYEFPPELSIGDLCGLDLSRHPSRSVCL